MAATAASVPVKYADDITECPICADVLTDPRVLPCIHTFCLVCIQGYSKNAKVGEQRPCPLCRQDFIIPPDGFEGLPKDYFVEKIVDMKQLAFRLAEDDVECDFCIETKSAQVKRKKAAVFCAECSRNMCDQCVSYHTMFKANSAHKVISLNKKLTEEDLLRNSPESRCDKHSEEVIKLYCFRCKLAVCMMCYVEEHSSHKCSDVRKVSEQLIEQLDDDISDLHGMDGDCMRLLKELEDDRNKFCRKTADTEKAICDEAEKWHTSIEKYKQNILGELKALNVNTNQQLETIRQETELQSVVIENFVLYGKEVKQKGTACDVAKLVTDLHRRANKLRQFDVHPDYNINVKFKRSATYDDSRRELGKLDLEDDFITLATLKHAIPSARSGIVGLATLENCLFVAREARQQIDVYDTETFALLDSVQVANLSQPQGLAVCDFHECLYISDQRGNLLLSATLPECINVTQWSVMGGQPCGLSVNKEHNLLVACCGGHKVKEYTNSGNLVREVSLHPHINAPTHVIQLPNGNFCISHQGPVPGISVVGGNGKVVLQYLKEVKQCRCQSGTGQEVDIGSPAAFAIDNSRRILVADQRNNRIVIRRNSAGTLEAEALPGSVCGTLSQPCRLHFDATKKRLYVGEFGGGRVLCCGI